jgi:predicted branched-subunit amino acid permease
VGDIGLWEVSSGESLLSRNFKVWDIAACSMMFKVRHLLYHASIKQSCF